MANQLRTAALQFGFISPSAPSESLVNTTVAESATGTWIAHSFIPDYAANVTEVSVYCSAVGGSLGVNDVVCAIYSNTGNKPNASLSSTNTLSAAIAPGWVRFTGLNQAVSAATQYWAVFENVNGTPAANFPTSSYVTGLQLPLYGPSASTICPVPRIATTVNSGTAWTRIGSCAQIRIKYNDNTYDGIPISALATDATNKIYSTNYAGAKITLPGTAALTWNIAGFSMPVQFIGAPTGTVKLMLFVGAATSPTATVTTADLYTDLLGVGASVVGTFATPVAVPGGTTIRIALGDTAADSSAACYEIRYYQWDSDANSTPLIPSGIVETAFNGAAWADQPNQIPAFNIFFNSIGGELSGGTAPLVVLIAD